MNQSLLDPETQDELTFVNSLVSERVPEGEHYEFKKELSRRGKGPDPWMEGKNETGEKSRNMILEEATAFANAYGGTLILGIEESDESPSVAVRLSPIPRCAELVDRLRNIFRDCVEPTLPRLKITPVPIKGEDGVIVIRVERSRVAPHRVTTSRVCPIRRADRCEPMTMREIQDLTLNVARGMERLEARLQRQSEALKEEMNKLSNPDDCFGIRFTAFPIGEETVFEDLFEREQIASALTPIRQTVTKIDERRSQQLDELSEYHGGRWRPILRGARKDAYTPIDDELFIIGYHEIHCDGLFEIGFAYCGENPLSPDYPIVLFANLAEWARRSRASSNVPMAEYAIDVEIRVEGDTARTGYHFLRERAALADRTGGGTQMMDEWVPKLKNVRFPRYSLEDMKSREILLSIFSRDYWNSVGKHGHPGTTKFRIEP